MSKVKKTGFEIYTEVETIVANMQGLIDALCLVDNCFSLDNNTLDSLDAMNLVANHETIRNIHNLVETELHEIIEKIEAIQLEKDSDPEPNESAN